MHVVQGSHTILASHFERVYYDQLIVEYWSDQMRGSVQNLGESGHAGLQGHTDVSSESEFSPPSLGSPYGLCAP